MSVDGINLQSMRTGIPMSSKLHTSKGASLLIGEIGMSKPNLSHSFPYGALYTTLRRTTIRTLARKGSWVIVGMLFSATPSTELIKSASLVTCSVTKSPSNIVISSNLFFLETCTCSLTSIRSKLEPSMFYA